MVSVGLSKQGLEYPKPNVGGIPYMGEKGCVVAPEHRPYCTGFICAPHFQDREFRREYDRLVSKITQDPEAPKLPDIVGNLPIKRKS